MGFEKFGLDDRTEVFTQGVGSGRDSVKLLPPVDVALNCNSAEKGKRGVVDIAEGLRNACLRVREHLSR